MPKSDLTEEERSAARDFVMARLAAARGQVALAEMAIDEALQHFVDPQDDTNGKKRAEMIETADAALADAARSVQLAGTELGNIDPDEQEPDIDDDGMEDEPETRKRR